MKTVQTKNQVKFDVTQMVVSTALFRRASEKWFKDFVTRDVDVFFSDGYGEPSNRTTFFCVKGSPNRFYGHINNYGGNCKTAVTNWGIFKWRAGRDGKHRWYNTSKKKLG